MYTSLCAIRSWNWNWKLTQDNFLIEHWIQRTHRCSAVRCWPWGIYSSWLASRDLGTTRSSYLAWVGPVLPLDGVGSCRLFFTVDLHDTLSWVPASDKPHTFKSCFTHSSQVFFGRLGAFLPRTGLDLTLFISPLERMACPNHISRRSRWYLPVKWNMK